MAELHEELSEGPCGTPLPASRVSPTVAPDCSEQIPGVKRQRAWYFVPVFCRRGILCRHFLRSGNGDPRRGQERFRIVAGPCRGARTRSFAAGNQLALSTRIDAGTLGKSGVAASPKRETLLLRERSTTDAKENRSAAGSTFSDSGQVESLAEASGVADRHVAI